ncbi:MAG: hypothetical protein ACI9AF_000052 [Granulosicoccus sp.]
MGHPRFSVKFLLLCPLPLILASCSDLTPKEQEEPAGPAIKVEPIQAPPVPEVAPAPPINGPGNPLGYLDPDTTDELMTEEKKKTVTTANAQAPPPVKTEGDSAIDVDPPALPMLDLPEER